MIVYTNLENLKDVFNEIGRQKDMNSKNRSSSESRTCCKTVTGNYRIYRREN